MNQHHQNQFSIELPASTLPEIKRSDRIRESILRHFGAIAETEDCVFFECTHADSERASRYVTRLLKLCGNY